MDKMRERFLAGKLEQNQLKYIGCNILQQDDGIFLDQTEFVVEELEDVMIALIRASRVDKCTAWRSRGGGILAIMGYLGMCHFWVYLLLEISIAGHQF